MKNSKQKMLDDFDKREVKLPFSKFGAFKAWARGLYDRNKSPSQIDNHVKSVLGECAKFEANEYSALEGLVFNEYNLSSKIMFCGRNSSERRTSNMLVECDEFINTAKNIAEEHCFAARNKTESYIRNYIRHSNADVSFEDYAFSNEAENKFNNNHRENDVARAKILSNSLF